MTIFLTHDRTPYKTKPGENHVRKADNKGLKMKRNWKQSRSSNLVNSYTCGRKGKESISEVS